MYTIPLLMVISSLMQAQDKPRAFATPALCPSDLRHVAQPDSRYSFAQASLTALSFARSATREADAFEAERKETERKGGSWQNDLIGMMRHTKTASETYTCAEKVLEPYIRSRDERIIRSTAEFQILVYKHQIILNDQFLDILRKLPELADRPTEYADRISTIEVERGKLWTDLTQATTLALLGLVDRSATDNGGILNKLVITRMEHRELLDQLLEFFPELKEQKTESSWGMPAKIAALYYSFLSKTYRCADE